MNTKSRTQIKLFFKINPGIIIGLLLFMISGISCKKYLDQKPVASLVVPSTLTDLQATLDNPQTITFGVETEFESDNIYWNTADYQLFSSYPVASISMAALIYSFDKNAVYDNNWISTYTSVVYPANLVLDMLPTITVDTKNQSWSNAVKGSALFYRAFAFYGMAQFYCLPYSINAKTDLGISLRLTADINVPSTRSTVQETYDQILVDLKTAADLLPDTVSIVTRPTKAAAYGLLARTYLSMRDYSNAGKYADLCLQKNKTLLNYNSLLPLGNPPIARYNPEVIYHDRTPGNSVLSNTYAKIDSTLYKSYDLNDLRKTVFFVTNSGTNAGTYGFQGSYDGTTNPYTIFDGITTSEMFLIRAESFARAGNISSAMNDLDTLLTKRYKPGTFVPLVAVNADDALNKVLIERRKELIYRGLRWSDLRRFNLEGSNISLTRIINGVTYTLSPNDPRWVGLIPFSVINMTGMPQNPR